MRLRMSEIGWRVAQAAAIAGFTALGVAGVAAQQKAPDPKDPRIGLKPGLHDAGTAASGIELVSARPRPQGFFDPEHPAGDAMPPERPANASAPAPPPPHRPDRRARAASTSPTRTSRSAARTW